MQVLLLILVAVVLLPSGLQTGGESVAVPFTIAGTLALIVAATMLSMTLRRGLHDEAGGARDVRVRQRVGRVQSGVGI